MHHGNELPMSCVRGRHGRGQGQGQGRGQGSSRPRPQNFVLEVSSRSRPVLEDPIHGSNCLQGVELRHTWNIPTVEPRP